jgi:predicted nuclease of predicted toxin-antitoxin system
MDHHVHAGITHGLRLRGADVLTTEQDGTQQVADTELLDRAGALGRVLFTQDEDFLVETARRQQEGEPFVGVIFGRQQRVTVGGCVRDLEILCLAGEPADFANLVTYLPL